MNTFSELQRSLAAMERVFEVLGMPADRPDRTDARPAPATVRELRFENVSFEYRENQPVVKDFSVTVPRGSVVALTGRSGAGNTTVTDLVARFHDPTRGRIVVNGIDIREFKFTSYRDLLAIVQQDVFLFDGSVRENIAYGSHTASDAEVEDAARREGRARLSVALLPPSAESPLDDRWDITARRYARGVDHFPYCATGEVMAEIHAGPVVGSPLRLSSNPSAGGVPCTDRGVSS